MKTLNMLKRDDLPYKFKKTFIVILFLLSIIFVLIISLNISTYPASYSNTHFDSFHEGETLGTAISYMEGKVPYKESLFVHGIFQDPLRSVIAFKLFGKSIGSVRTLQSIIKLLSFFLLFILLLKLFQQNYLYAHITFLILTFASLSHYVHLQKVLLFLPRDITTYLFIILFLSQNKFITDYVNFSTTKFTIITFFFSFIPLASFAYSIDRGFYLFATYILLSPVMYFYFKKRGVTKLYIISSVFGLVTAILLLGILLRGDFSSFFKFVFLELPRYKELMDGKIYQFYNIKFLFPVSIIALNLYWIIYHLLNELFTCKNLSSSLLEFIKTHLTEICLLVMSIFFFRSALGRSDLNHVIYSSIISYILAIYIFIKRFLHPFLQKKIVPSHLISFFTITTISLLTIAGSYRICTSEIIRNNFPYDQRDSDFIPNNYKKTIDFINNNLGENENFFTMTSEAIWYYYINKPSPTKFAVIWFAAPHFYQDQVVRELKTNNVKLILYKNEFWASAIDGITSQVRLPIIDTYIKSNYSFFKKIDDNELWIDNSN